MKPAMHGYPTLASVPHHCVRLCPHQHRTPGTGDRIHASLPTARGLPRTAVEISPKERMYHNQVAFTLVRYTHGEG
jgi:hypothetical protein